MAEEVTREEIAAAQRAVMLEDGCGLTIEGERTFCDDPRTIEPTTDCVCKRAGRAAAIAASQSRPTKGAAPSVSEIDELYSRAFDMSRVVLDRDSCRDDFCDRLRDVWPDLRASLISALNWMELFQDEPMTASEHSELGEAIERLQGVRTKGAAPSLQKRPIAFRAKDAFDRWILFDNEDEAASYARDTGFEYQGLYARDGKSPAPSPAPAQTEEVTKEQIEAAVAVLSPSMDGCTSAICADVLSENCECGKLVRKALLAAYKVRR